MTLDPIDPAVSIRFCTGCGEAMAPAAKFCTGCGTPAGAAPSPASGPLQASFAQRAAQFGSAARGFGTASAIGPGGCERCAGDGSRLASEAVFCPTCRWLRPLSPGYDLPVETFMWQFDATAMRTLNGIKPLGIAARAISERVGRPWLEASVNGIRLSERQLPDVFAIAIKAARILGLHWLPEIYVSGDQPWDAMTLGSETGAFVVIGSALLSFKEDDLLFVIGREMGHCRAGHALWKTVCEVMFGRQSNRRAIAGGGLMQFLSPERLIGAAVDAPLMAWARHADITADRAGALAVGREEVVRRVLLQLALRSFPLFDRLDIDAWKEQESASAANTAQFSEWTLASTPFVAGRLRVLVEFLATGEVERRRREIETALPVAVPPAARALPARPSPTESRPPFLAASPKGRLRVRCTGCAGPVAFDRPAASMPSAFVKCPACGAVMRLDFKPKAAPLPAPDPALAEP